jgi:8-oxo-dGTP pyrophosphatase MutT (NUDIX family)
VRVRWDFPRTHADAIAAIWQEECRARPRLFDGRVLLQHSAAIAGGVMQATYFETGYKPFLSWLRLGCPGEDAGTARVRNGFAMAALRAADGAFLLGRMAAHTANGGQVYFASGTPDLGDVRADGTLDLAGSVLRELSEETGLNADEGRVTEGWTAVMDGHRVALMRPVTVDLPAAGARLLMLSRIAAQPQPELDDIVIIRDASEVAAHATSMPRFMQCYLAHMLG